MLRNSYLFPMKWLLLRFLSKMVEYWTVELVNLARMVFCSTILSSSVIIFRDRRESKSMCLSEKCKIWELLLMLANIFFVMEKSLSKLSLAYWIDIWSPMQAPTIFTEILSKNSNPFIFLGHIRTKSTSFVISYSTNGILILDLRPFLGDFNPEIMVNTLIKFISKKFSFFTKSLGMSCLLASSP